MSLILEYHSVSDARRDALSVGSAAFEAQMSDLLARGWKPLPLADLAARIGAGRDGAREFSVTFDDGYRDNHDVAWPILRRLGVPATIFLAVDYVGADRAFPWDDHVRIGASRALTWEMVGAMAAEGLVSFGSHTNSHPDLTAIDEDAAREEIRGSRTRLEERLGAPVTAFCYPHSRANARVKEMVRAAGYTIALRSGARGRDPLDLPRVGVYRHTGSREFRFKLTRLGRALREQPGLRGIGDLGRAALRRGDSPDAPAAKEAARRPRVLQVLTCLEPGGAEAMVLDLSRGLARHADVSVACLKGEGALAPAFRRAGNPVHALGIEGVRHAAGLWRLLDLIRSGRFDLVHTHLLHAGIVGRALARLARVRAIVHTQHNTLHWETDSLLLARVNRATLRFADRVIAVGETVADRVARHGGVPQGRIVTIRNGVDTNRFRPADARGFLAEAFGVPPDAPLVGAVAGLRPVKGHDVLLPAMQEVVRVLPAARLLLVGDGPLRGAIEEEIAARGLSDRTILAGTRTDVEAIVPGCDVIALSSREEGVPVSVLEAMACAVPVVATRVGGTPEVVADGRTGLLVPPGDPDALAGALIRLLRSPEEARVMGKEGREAALERFSTEAMVARTWALYETLLAGRGRRARRVRD